MFLRIMSFVIILEYLSCVRTTGVIRYFPLPYERREYVRYTLAREDQGVVPNRVQDQRLK